MTGISTLHAASLLRRHDLKLDSHGAMGTLGNLKFAAAGGTAPSRRAHFFDKIGIRLGALKDVLFSSSQQRADMRARGETLRAEKRCAHLFGKLTAPMIDGAGVASVDKTLRRMTNMMPAQDVEGKWRGPLQDALTKVNAKDLEAMREGLQDLEQAYPVSVGLPPENVRALVGLLKGMLVPAGAGPVPEQASTEPSTSATASAPTPAAATKTTPTLLSPQASDATEVGEGAGPNPPQALIPPPPPPPPPPAGAKSSAPKPQPFPGPDEASAERSHHDALADAIRNPQLRKATPSPDAAGAKRSHHDELLDAIRSPQLKSREQADEAFKKIVDKDKAKVDAAKDKALTPEQRKFGGLHGGLMDEIKGAEGLSPSQLKGRVKKSIVDSPEVSVSKASTDSQPESSQAKREDLGAPVAASIRPGTTRAS
ncbi:hypothetical protein ACOTEE_17245 [Achromobacter xylosoxidans]|uniref:hypothetical protein n=1 Tax=Alcaligenes xylosoxydans xylosoxydans TaxID=85698 RepID=UPI00336A8BE1